MYCLFYNYLIVIFSLIKNDCDYANYIYICILKIRINLNKFEYIDFLM